MGSLWSKLKRGGNSRNSEGSSGRGGEGKREDILGKRKTRSRTHQEHLDSGGSESSVSEPSSAMGGLWSSKGKNKDREGEGEGSNDEGDSRKKQKMVTGFKVQGASPFIWKRRGSMFLDEDGDLAHEFYVEERVESRAGVVRWAMKRVFHNLTPQGELELPFPRLHVDYPAVIIETSIAAEHCISRDS